MTDIEYLVREYATACMRLNEAKKSGMFTNIVMEVNLVTITGQAVLREMLNRYGFNDLEQPS